ncbi:MAG: D-alanine--D-alanine ligase, partial [Pseudomonadales bacterium]
GMSAEREISLLSGTAVFEGLKRLGFKVTAIDVGEDIISRLQQVSPTFVFNMLHGKGGEDGVIQGLLEIMGIPYTGSGVLASALAMDKVKSKLIWQRLGLSTAEFLMLTNETDWEAAINELGTAVVKPVNGGSSLGIEIVNDANALRAQFENARKYDSEVMAERYIKGSEFSVGVLHGELLPPIELRTKRKFFTYDAKYFDEDTEYICPPELSEDHVNELNELVLEAYRSLDCSGLARVDVMQDSDGKFYLLELNTVPGMTSHSFVPMAAKKAGMGFDELLLQIVQKELEVASL